MICLDPPKTLAYVQGGWKPEKEKEKITREGEREREWCTNERNE